MTVRLLIGDCRDVLKTLPDESVHCVCTSPPYWGLRSYLPADHPNKHMEIGSEPTVHEWVRTMVEVFREVRRVLRSDGVAWVNFGDSYAANRAYQVPSTKGGPKHSDSQAGGGNGSVVPDGLKPKDLIGQPWRAAFALQADGWWLRQDVIWGKKNPMPESVTDRFTKAHEYVFLLTKSERYWFDLGAVKEEASEGTHARYAANGGKAPQGAALGHGDLPRDAAELSAWKQANGYEKGAAVGRRQGPPGNPAENESHNPKASKAETENPGAYADGKSERMGRGAGWRERKLAEAGGGTKNNGSFDEAMAVMPQTRNPRDVRLVDEDEFEQFLRWKAEQKIVPDVLRLASEPFRGAHFATFPPALIEPFILAGCPPGGVVLDPFGGSGTTGLVADRHHRDAILIDLDDRNAPMARERIHGEAPLFSNVIEEA